ncbi:unnamed protein product [Chrysoparadoxa australica]
MKTACVALAGVASAAAFAPTAFTGAQLTAAAPKSSSLKMSFNNELGAQAPLGYFDPLGLLKGASQERFERLRHVEIKHGRIAMIAVLGHITAQNTRFPGYLSKTQDLTFADMPNGLAAIQKIPVGGLCQILLFIGCLELFAMKQVEGSFPGDYDRNPKPNKFWNSWSEEKQMKKRAVELNNGRAAQMGILGMMVHEQLNGHPYVINDLLGASYTFNGV